MRRGHETCATIGYREDSMKVLVVGSGAREHALLLKLSKSPQVTELFVVPGNAGIAELATRLPIPKRQIDDLDAFLVGLADLAEDHDIDLTVVGHEDLLVGGIVDVFQARGLRIFGPSAAAARIEGSKIWA